MNTYSSYKDSGVEWIGEIPSDWGKTKIKFHFNLVGGFPFDSKLITNEVTEYPIIRIGNVTSGKIDVFYEGELIDKIPVVENGDYVVSLTGDFSIREWNNRKSLLNQRCGLFKSRNNSSIRFLYYLLPFHFRVLEKTKYFTTLKNLSNDEVLNLFLLNPPIDIQTKIVSFLDNKTQKIDELIEKTEQKIKLLKEKRTSLINHCVTKGLNPDVEMKDSGVEWIGEIPNHWEVKPIKYISDYNQDSLGIDTSPDYELDYLEISDVNSVGKISNPTHYTFSKSPSRCRRILKKNDIIISTVRTYLRSIGFIENEVQNLICSTGFCVLSPKDIIKPKLLFYLVRSEWFISDVISQSVGVSYPGIQTEKLMGIKILLPPTNEQNQIVEYLDEQTQKIDSTIEKETQRIELLKEYRQSLISEVVTGKIDVRDWNG